MKISIKKVNEIITIAILITCVILFILLSLFKTDNCDLCKFNVDGNELNTNQFINLYAQDCFYEKQYPNNLTLTNLSGG